jgi:hypothetical protein
MTGFYKDYQDASDTHENSAESYATDASNSASAAAQSANVAQGYANEAAQSLADQEDLEVTNVTFFSDSGNLSATKANGDILTTPLDGRYAELSGADFTGSISIPSLSELQSQGNLNLRFNSEDSNSLATFNLYPDDSDYTALSVNSLGNVFIGSSALAYGSPSTYNKLSVGSMGTVSASEATVGIKANSSYQALAMQANGTNNTVKFNVLDNGNLTVGGAATTNLTLTASGDLTVLGDIEGRDVAYDGSKLDTIEPAADVTDTANVTAAGAVMDGDFTSNGLMKRTGVGTYTVDTNTYLTTHQDISGKADLSGATFTGDVLFNDGVKAKFGTDSDLLIYHNDGEPSVIEDAGELGLLLKTNGNVFGVVTDTNENMILAQPDGNVSLFFNNQQKLATTDSGISVTGTVNGIDLSTVVTTTNASFDDDVKLKFGASDDLLIYHDTTSTDKSVIEDSGANGLHLISDGNGIFFESPTQRIISAHVPSGGVTFAELYYNNSSKFETTNDGVSVTGDIAVSGTVDGRDVAADGTKLDGLERTVRQRFQRRGYNNTVSLNALTTTYSQLGGNLRINSGETTAVENELDLNLTASHLDVNSSNEGLFVVTVDAPDPTTETTVNLGTVTGAAFGVFSVSGDFTKHFSPYCGLSKNSDGSNAINFSNQQGWEYNPATNITSVYYYPYQTGFSVGDTVYLHPFDWETTGTEINGDEYPFEAYNENGTATQNHFHQIYLGYYKPERTFKIKAKEISTSENIQITRVAGTYSQIIGS